MRPTHRPVCRTGLPALLLCALACATSPASAADDPADSETVEVRHGEVAGTLKMMAAHAPLRTRAVVDADSPGNRRVLRAMLRKFLQTAASVPHDQPEFPRSDAPLVATLTGKFSVNNKGAAQYSMDLRLPEGRRDLEPDLSISYYSQSGQGPMGRGFSLSTGWYDAITRGRTLLARDDVVRAKELGARDIFYLDGKRLICVSGPETYGRPGSDYRTEVDSFVRIHASGTGDEIETFTLVDRWGRTCVFGRVGTAEDGLHRGHDDTANRPWPTPMQYALKLVRDTLGNTIEFSYADKGFGEWVLAHIDYTGGPERAPGTRVVFDHEERRLHVPKYECGLRVDNAQRLTGIRVIALAKNAIVTHYVFEYASDGAGTIDHLTAIHPHCADEIGSPLLAAAPMRFHWSHGLPTDRKPLDLGGDTLKAASMPDTPLAPADFDGDGKTDLLTFGDDLSVVLSSAKGIGSAPTTWLGAAAIARDLAGARALALHTVDFDGDGRTDVLLVDSSGKTLPARSDGKAFIPLPVLDLGPLPTAPAAGSADGSAATDRALTRIVPGDFDGDGRDDIAAFGRGKLPRLFLSEGASFQHAATPEAPGAPIASPDADYVDGFAEDLNGDGCEDLVWLEHASASATAGETRLICAIIQPEGHFAPPQIVQTWDGGPETAQVVSGDVNDDGLSDLLVYAPVGAANPWTVHLNRGRPTGTANDARASFLRVDAPAGILPRLPAMARSPARSSGTVSTPTPASNAPIRYHASKRPSLGVAAAFSVLDIDADGLDDCTWFAPSPQGGDGAWWACASNGDGTFRAPAVLDGPLWTRLAAAAARATSPHLVLTRAYDFNGDGAQEWTLRCGRRIDRATLNAVLGPDPRELDGGPFDVVTVFVDGMAEQVHTRYKAARDDSVYAAGVPVDFPLRDIRTAQPVVSDLWRDTGGAGFSQFSYQYSGNRLDLSGRGPLGFAAFTTIDRHTNFVKYQHLAQSYPLTGLTLREETHWFWVKDGRILTKSISAEDHTVVCDFVVDPATGAPLGTVLPFVTRHTESRWRADLAPDSTLRASEVRDLEDASHAFPRPTDAPLEQTTTTTWRDLQDHGEPLPTQYPRLDVAHALSPGYEGAAPRVPAAHLRGRITYGNQTRRLVVHRPGDVEDTVETFRTPRDAADPLTSQRETTRTTRRKGRDAAVPGPLTTTTYFRDTTLVASETEEPAADADTSARIAETVYERDDQGRLIRRIERTRDPARPDEPAKETVAYQALAFDDVTDQPTRILDPEDGDRSVQYHPLSHQASVITYDQGGIVEFWFDGFGRTRQVWNRVNGYHRATEFAWTTSEAYGWRKAQVVTGPPSAGGLALTSIYAERTTKRGKPTITTYYDRTGRTIRVIEEAPEGGALHTDTVVNGLGQTVAVSKPYVPGGPQSWTVTKYDSYGRAYPSEEITVAAPQRAAAPEAPATPAAPAP